jgi:hypothetical protein
MHLCQDAKEEPRFLARHLSDMEDFLKVIVRSLPPPFMRPIPSELPNADRLKTQEKFKSSGSLHKMEKLEKEIKLKKLAKLVNVKFWQPLSFQLTHLTLDRPCRSQPRRANATMLTMFITFTTPHDVPGHDGIQTKGFRAGWGKGHAIRSDKRQSTPWQKLTVLSVKKDLNFVWTCSQDRRSFLGSWH